MPQTEESPQKTPSIHSLAQVLLGIAAAIVALFVADVFLAKIERQESHVEAARYYDAGERLMIQDKAAEAAEQFRSAFAEERDNQQYQLALGQSLRAAGNLTEAESTLDDLLTKDPFSGPANLAMARVFLKEGRSNQAASFYHRAIYGQWKENPKANQVQVRFELVDLLAKENQKQDLLAELLPLQDQAPRDLGTQKKIARLFITAGSPARAADVLDDLLKQHPNDAEAHALLGEAEFARGNYRVAEAEFRESLRQRPGDQDTVERLGMVQEVLNLDPARRGLGVQEQYNRSVKLAQSVLDDVRQCLGAAPPADAQQLMDDVDEGLKKPVRPANRADAIETNLNWADQLWQVRQMDCKQAIGPSEQPLALVMAMLSR